MNSLTVAKFKDGYIRIEDYNKSIHSPFCNPPLEITGVKNKIFRAPISRTTLWYFKYLMYRSSSPDELPQL
ncbi:hypothetical protein [Desulfosporosinus shakirovi]|uniref:hypothetical protein n=1 Tax=Desulfosporosinus shakirovi TaxID=2885154 RepID=UPI001E39BFDB|nr:hypothetical protein [Desulfosporosinus sp. SRJS8]MCB8818778.1 hypothetical protein [Desulfosporosinus sp. SRJS8]